MDNLLQIYPSIFILLQIHSDHKKLLNTDYGWATVLGAAEAILGQL